MSYEAPPGGETMAERQARLLAAFSVRASRIGHIIADRIEAADAEDNEDNLARLTTAYAAVGRALRQTIALEHRLARQVAQDERNAAQAAEARASAVARRKQACRIALQDQAADEVEDYDFNPTAEQLDAPVEVVREMVWGRICDDIDAVLDTAAADPAAFLAEPLERQLARFAGQTLWRDVEDDDEAWDDDEDDEDAEQGASPLPPAASAAPPELRADSS